VRGEPEAGTLRETQTSWLLEAQPGKESLCPWTPHKGSLDFAPSPALFLPPAAAVPLQEVLISGNISLAHPMGTLMTQPPSGAQDQQSSDFGIMS
jgi:hypothetical protein